jgi:predicted dehydrogenase
LEAKPGAWREQVGEGNGVLWDLGPHLIDHALVLFGAPEAVYADVRREREHAKVDDSFDLYLQYPAMTALLRATMVACVARPWFVVNGTGGSFVKRGIDPQEAQLKAGMTPDDPRYGVEDEKNWGALTVCVGGDRRERRIPTERSDYSWFYANVRDAIRGDAALEVTAEQARDVVRVIELAHESSRTGKRLAFRR